MRRLANHFQYASRFYIKFPKTQLHPRPFSHLAGVGYFTTNGRGIRHRLYVSATEKPITIQLRGFRSQLVNLKASSRSSKDQKLGQQATVFYEDKILRRNVGNPNGRRTGASLGVRIYNQTNRKQLHDHVIPIIVHYPSGLPVVVVLPQQTIDTSAPTISENWFSEQETNPQLLISEQDHDTATLLAYSSGCPVFVPAYFLESEHIVEQLKKPPPERNLTKNSTSKTVDILQKAIYPYPRFPQSLHLSIVAYETILSHLPGLIPDYFQSDSVSYTDVKAGNIIVSLCFSGSLIGANLASTISLTDFKHHPFETFRTFRSKYSDPGKATDPKHSPQVATITVELAAVSLISPITAWTFRPLGGFDFELDHWLVPPTLPRPPTLPITSTYPQPRWRLIPKPDLPTLLSLRSNYFTSPEWWTDYHASPLFFFRTPGVDVGIERLAGIRYSLDPLKYLYISMEGTRRQWRPKKYPPFWLPPSTTTLYEPLPGGLPANMLLTLASGDFDDGSYEDVFAIENEIEEVEEKEEQCATFEDQAVTNTPLGHLDDDELEDIIKGKKPKESELMLAEMEYAVDMIDASAYRHIPLKRQYEILSEILKEYQEEVIKIKQNQLQRLELSHNRELSKGRGRSSKPKSDIYSGSVGHSDMPAEMPPSLTTQSHHFIEFAIDFADSISRSWVQHVENTASLLKIYPVAYYYHIKLHPVNNDITRVAYQEDLIGLQNLRIEKDPSMEMLSADEMGSMVGEKTKVRKRVEVQMVNLDVVCNDRQMGREKGEWLGWTKRETEAIRNIGSWVGEVTYEHGLRRYRELLWKRKEIHEDWVAKRNLVNAMMRVSPEFKAKQLTPYDMEMLEKEFKGFQLHAAQTQHRGTPPRKEVKQIVRPIPARANRRKVIST